MATELGVEENFQANQQSLFEGIFITSIDPIITIDEFGSIISFNPAAEKMLGYSKEEMFGRNVKMIMPTPYKDEHDGYLANYRNTNQRRIIGIGREVEVQTKDNKIIPIHLSVSEAVVEGKRIFIGIARDITKIKSAQEEIKKTNEELSRQNWLRQGIVNLHESIKGDLKIEEMAKRIIRETALYLKAQTGVFYIVENDQIKLYAGHAYPSNVQREYLFNEGLIGRTAVEKRIIRISDISDQHMNLDTAFGKVQCKEIIAVPLVYDGGTIALMELAFIDVVDDNTVDFLKSLTDSLGISINSTINRDRITSLLEETQRQSEELQSQQEELKASNEELQQKSIELETQQKELEAINQKLENKQATLEAQKKRLEIINKDLSRAQKNLEQKAKDLELSNKYKSEFLANMSHELRTPLNSILILSKLIFEEKTNVNPETQKENAKIIYDSGVDLLNLINDVLDLSKVEAGKLEIKVEQIITQQLINSLDRTFRTQIENKNLSYAIEVDQDLPQIIYSDKLRLEQILKNFISNAIKFTEKGEIKISFNKADNDSISIAVKDTGIGIPEDKRQLIFEAFQQVDGSITRRFGGSGLGLSISRSLAEKLGAFIEVESKLEQGSTFKLTMPINFKNILEPKQPVHSDAEIEPVEEIQVTTTKLTSLIVDDRASITKEDKVILLLESEEKLAENIINHCHQMGYKCLISASGEDGLDDAIKFSPNSIIVDTDLPDQNGLMILDRLKNNPQTRHIPIYVLSDGTEKSQLIKLGAVGTLNKNEGEIDVPAIIKKLEKIYQQKNKKVLLIEDNEIEQDSIKKLINDRSIEVESVASGAGALDILKERDYDCIILDLKLQDMTGFDFLNIIKDKQEFANNIAPIIVHTGKDLNSEEQRTLEEVSSSIVLKGVKSPERLLNEVMLFLHKAESEISEEKQNILKYARHRDQVYEGKKILIVDDDIRNVYSIKQILQDRNMELFLASTGKEAIDKLNEYPEIDIVLMDIMMPEMNGYVAMEEIRKSKNRKQLPILALTAKAMPDDRNKCIKSGANDYLPKPIDPDRLLSLLRVWLSR